MVRFVYQSEVSLDLAVHIQHYSRHAMVNYNPFVMIETSIVWLIVVPISVRFAVVIGLDDVEAHPVTPKGRS